MITGLDIFVEIGKKTNTLTKHHKVGFRKSLSLLEDENTWRRPTGQTSSPKRKENEARIALRKDNTNQTSIFLLTSKRINVTTTPKSIKK